MVIDLLIHPATRHALGAYRKQPVHALLFVGPDGIGKRTLAVHWAQSFGAEPQIVEPDEKGSIGIEAIRDLYRASRSKRQERQVIIVDHAEAMSLEAENALLKLLEEPRDGVTFVLTAPTIETLLPTIVSRTQHVVVLPLGDEILRRMAVQANLKASDIAQALFIARGRPATLARLMADNAQFDQEREYMRQAKALLAAPPYERFVVISKLAHSRDSCIAVLEAMLHMVKLQIKHSTEAQLAGWLERSKALEKALAHIQRNGNIRVQLLRLFSSY